MIAHTHRSQYTSQPVHIANALNTPSHFLMTAVLARSQRRPLPNAPLLWGSIAPDIPLWGLSLGGWVYFHYGVGLGTAETFRLMFDDLYFNHPFWLAAHNFLHAPMVIAIGLVLALRWRRWRPVAVRSLRWLCFFAACGLHCVVDIFTHADDGPLVGFPLNWQWRFASPVSYWDPRYGGDIFQWFELAFDLLAAAYLLAGPIARRWQVFRDR